MTVTQVVQQPMATQQDDHNSANSDSIRNETPDLAGLRALVKALVPRKSRNIVEVLRSSPRRTSDLRLEVALIEDDSDNMMNVDFRYREKYLAFRKRWQMDNWLPDVNGEKLISVSLAKMEPLQSAQISSSIDLCICIQGFTSRQTVKQTLLDNHELLRHYCWR